MTHVSTEQTFWDRNRILIKGLLIGFLILLMLIPGAFISSLVQERQNRKLEVIKEVSSKWAGGQSVTGPVLMVPYKQYTSDANGRVTETIKNAFFLPDKLQIKSDLAPEVRHRSLYDVTLYKAGIQLEGTFSALPIAGLQIAPENMLWPEARLLLGIEDARGLDNEVQVAWNSTKTTLEAGMPDNKLFKEGLSTPVGISAGEGATFNITLHLKGSEYLYFTPVGRTTEVNMTAPWKDPAFDGQYLPAENPDINDKGFAAHWKILPPARSYPECWKDNNIDLQTGAFGVKLVQPVDSYTKTDRSVKYAILFIALTFTVFFFIEIMQKKQVHPLQYLLVGFALCIFYTLLLSISEYMGFNAAYLIASAATVSLIGMYVWSIFKNGKTAIVFTLALLGLYTYIYILIQLQDYALLFGSIGLFIILAIIMYYSRKIDWYSAAHHNARATNSDDMSGLLPVQE